jgi:hypothetical protein
VGLSKFPAGNPKLLAAIFRCELCKARLTFGPVEVGRSEPRALPFLGCHPKLEKIGEDETRREARAEEREIAREGRG